MKTTLLGICLFMGFMLQGQDKKSSKNYTSTITTTAGADMAWKILTNTTEWKQWDSEIIDIKYEGPFQEKGIGTLITSAGKVNEFRITMLEENKAYIFKYKVSSGMLFIKRMVVATDRGSTITEEVWFKGISGKTFKKYFGENYSEKIQIKLQALKQLLEG